MAESSHCTKSTHENEPANDVFPSCSALCPAQNSCCVDKDKQQQYADGLDVLMNLVCSLLERNYEKSLQLCKRVIQCEPSNRIALQLFPVLLKNITEENEKEKGSGKSGSESTESSGSSSGSSRSSSRSCSRCSRSSSDSSSTDNLSANADSDSGSSTGSESESDIDGDLTRRSCKYNLKNS